MTNKREVIILIGLSILMFLAILLAVLNSNIFGFALLAGVEVINTPPNLTKDIPNFSWFAGEDYNNAFNLDDYFFDANEQGNLSYNYTGNYFINIVINESSHNVSFSQPATFIGSETVIFTAFDGVNPPLDSNPVILNVTNWTDDTEPPLWFNAQKNVSTVYQYNYTLFTANWTDNLNLGGYFFAINQSTGFVNYSYIPFSGKENISQYYIQITAPPNTTVFWYFFANDSNGNANQTEIFNFTVADFPAAPKTVTSPSPSAPAAQPVQPRARIPSFRRMLGLEEKEEEKILNFTVEPKFLKVSLKQGKSDTRVIKITNTGTAELNFNVTSDGLNDYLILSETDFSLKAGETKILTADFTASGNATPETYFGDILIRTEELEEVKIDVVLEINALELLFDLEVWVQEDSKNVNRNDPVIADLIIRSLKDFRPVEGTLYYALKDLDGNILDSGQETLTLSSNLPLVRTLNVGEANLGEHIFYARLTYLNEVVVSSDIFMVGKRFELPLKIAKINLWLILIIILIIVVVTAITKYHRLRIQLRLLRLYFLINEAHKMIEKGEFKKADNLYIKIKLMYREKIPKEILKDEVKVKDELLKLYNELRKQKLLAKRSKKDKEETKDKSEEKDSDKDKKSDKDLPKSEDHEKNSKENLNSHETPENKKSSGEDIPPNEGKEMPSLKKENNLPEGKSEPKKEENNSEVQLNEKKKTEKK